MGNVGRIGQGGVGDFPEPEAAAGAAGTVEGPRANEKPTLLEVFRGMAVIGPGSRGEAVAKIQQMLKEAGIPAGNEDGIYGRQTQRAVSFLQKASGLPVTGEVDGATYGALEAKVAGKLRPAGTGAVGVVTGGGGAGPSATIHFDSNFHQTPSADLVAGGKLTIDYDPARCSTLQHTHNGYPAWGIEGYVRFLPSGDVKSGSVMRFEDRYGSMVHPLNPLPMPLTVDIPKDATGVEIWFRNYTGADRPAEAFDSNFGKNYCFDVKKP